MREHFKLVKKQTVVLETMKHHLHRETQKVTGNVVDQRGEGKGKESRTLFTWYCVVMCFKSKHWRVCSDVTAEHVTSFCANLSTKQ